MKLILRTCVLMGLVSAAAAYEVQHSYSHQDGHIEFFGACDSGEALSVVKYSEQHFEIYTFETTAVFASLDQAAKAACQE